MGNTQSTEERPAKTGPAGFDAKLAIHDKSATTYSAENTVLFISVSQYTAEYDTQTVDGLPIANTHKQIGLELVSTLMKLYKVGANGCQIVLTDLLAAMNYEAQGAEHASALEQATRYSKLWQAQFSACKALAIEQLKKEGVYAQGELDFEIITWDKFDAIKGNTRPEGNQPEDAELKTLFNNFRADVAKLFATDGSFKTAVHKDAQAYQVRCREEGRGNIPLTAFLPYLLRELPYFMLAAKQQGIKNIVYYNKPLHSFTYLNGAEDLGIKWVRATHVNGPVAAYRDGLKPRSQPASPILSHQSLPMARDLSHETGSQASNDSNTMQNAMLTLAEGMKLLAGVMATAQKTTNATREVQDLHKSVSASGTRRSSNPEERPMHFDVDELFSKLQEIPGTPPPARPNSPVPSLEEEHDRSIANWPPSKFGSLNVSSSSSSTRTSAITTPADGTPVFRKPTATYNTSLHAAPIARQSHNNTDKMARIAENFATKFQQTAAECRISFSRFWSPKQTSAPATAGNPLPMAECEGGKARNYGSFRSSNN